MLSKEQINQAIRWINQNIVNYDLLQSIVSENTNTIEQVIEKYNKQYANNYSVDYQTNHKLTSPMTKMIFLYIYDVMKKNPNTFYSYNMHITNNIVHTKEVEYIYLPKLIQKINKENAKLNEEKKELFLKNKKLQLQIQELQALIETKGIS